MKTAILLALVCLSAFCMGCVGVDTSELDHSVNGVWSDSLLIWRWVLVDVEGTVKGAVYTGDVSYELEGAQFGPHVYFKLTSDEEELEFVGWNHVDNIWGTLFYPGRDTLLALRRGR